MAIAGRVMLRPCGDYDPATVYNILDMVTYDQCLWICRINNNVGMEPSLEHKEYWQLTNTNAVERITEAQIDELDGIDPEDPSELLEAITNEQIDLLDSIEPIEPGEGSVITKEEIDEILNS